MSFGNLLIVSFLFLTTFNCLITYFCSSSSLKYLSKTNSYPKAIKRIHLYDKYLLNTLTLLTSVVYIVLSYWYFVSLLEISDYFISLSLLMGFLFSLLTTFFSRLCYCYACNVLLKTKLSALQCFRENFFYLMRMFYPAFLISFAIPTIYVLNIADFYKEILSFAFVVGYLLVWLLSMPFKTKLLLNAKKIRNKDLLDRLNKLFKENNIKHYSLYYWDSSKSNEDNALISGFFKKHVFISSTLINKVSDRELEAIILHEIGHIKRHHIKKMFMLKTLLLIAMSIIIYYVVMFDSFNMWLLIILILVFIYITRINLVGSKRNEIEADLYVNGKGYGKDLISALKKIEVINSTNKIDEFLSVHPSLDNRTSKIEKNK